MKLYICIISRKKSTHAWNIYEKLLKVGRFPNFEGVKDEKVFFCCWNKSLREYLFIGPSVLWNIHKQKYYKQLYFWLNLLSHICLFEPMWSSVVWPDSLSWLIDKGEDKDWLTEKVNCWCTMLIVRYRDWKFKIMWPESLSCLSLSSLCLCLSAAQLSPGVCLSLNISVSLYPLLPL